MVRVSGRVVSWTMTRAATNYDILVQVQNPKTLAWRDVVRSETFTETTLSLAHEAAGQYRVWVRAKRNEAGDVYFSNWSLLNLFKLS